MPSHYDQEHSGRSHRGHDDDRDYRGDMSRRQGRGRSDFDYDGDHRDRGGEGRHDRSMEAPRDREGHFEGRGQSGWFGDSEGHSEASRRGWQQSSHEGSGWHGDSEGHSEAARRGWDNPDHGRSGLYGDPEGHSRAAAQRRDRHPEDDRSSRSDRYERGSVRGRGGSGRYD